jgi:hypothetical protein
VQGIVVLVLASGNLGERADTLNGVWRFWASFLFRLNNVFLGALKLSYGINNIFL